VKAEAFELMASQEDHHWWFVGRRAAVGALLDRIPLTAEARVLEAGCGTGGNLYMLAERGQVSAFEPSEVARSLAADKSREIDIHDGELPGRLPFEPGTFDLVVGLDVLEHIDDDVGALRALVASAKPDGRILLTVPAIKALWGSHDRRLSHVRRYSRASLRQLCAAAGTTIEYETYFNTVLAPIAVVLRMLEKMPGIQLGNQERMPPPGVNRALGRLFAAEAVVLRRASLPIGLSLGVILTRSE
jgi:SAM-dependent methyltransferase